MKCKNLDNLSPEDRKKLEEIEYRKALIRLHGFGIGEYSKVSKLREEEFRKKLGEVENESY